MTPGRLPKNSQKAEGKSKFSAGKCNEPMLVTSQWQRFSLLIALHWIALQPPHRDARPRLVPQFWEMPRLPGGERKTGLLPRHQATQAEQTYMSIYMNLQTHGQWQIQTHKHKHVCQGAQKKLDTYQGTRPPMLGTKPTCTLHTYVSICKLKNTWLYGWAIMNTQTQIFLLSMKKNRTVSPKPALACYTRLHRICLYLRMEKGLMPDVLGPPLSDIFFLDPHDITRYFAIWYDYHTIFAIFYDSWLVQNLSQKKC